MLCEKSYGLSSKPSDYVWIKLNRVAAVLKDQLEEEFSGDSSSRQSSSHPIEEPSNWENKPDNTLRLFKKNPHIDSRRNLTVKMMQAMDIHGVFPFVLNSKKSERIKKCINTAISAGLEHMLFLRRNLRKLGVQRQESDVPDPVAQKGTIMKNCLRQSCLTSQILYVRKTEDFFYRKKSARRERRKHCTSSLEKVTT